ncbi:ANTAR domain-containing response regulator [endosymbiont of Lamellibrachia barhami]|uniref:ANTAR domain-containing response regulator n=1 Tax=endosymbiont of Lamellibrachia barhami TaxID=205975 RepID=UPI0015AC60BC|nr:response regulator [endosymbiont of Lamellibrachia barhami]
MKETRLLLADDDGVVLATFGKGLRDAGYAVMEADSGEAAIGLAQNDRPDLAILDVRMPGMSGVEVAKEMRKIGVPVIFLSAYDGREIVESAVLEGALGYVVKPIDVSRMIPTIEAALGRAQELGELKLVGERLNHALDTGNLVNVAVGLIMERQRINRQEAFEVIRSRARSQRRKVRDVAAELLDAWDSLHELTAFEGGVDHKSRKGRT